MGVVGERYNAEVILVIRVNEVPLLNSTTVYEGRDRLQFSTDDISHGKIWIYSVLKCCCADFMESTFNYLATLPGD